MRTPRIAAAVSAIVLFVPALVVSAVSQRIPVVTQVQGVVFCTMAEASPASGVRPGPVSVTVVDRRSVSRKNCATVERI